ncbi:hypothetical protein Hanom_Chr15g01382711 [Helianthus anomalus]
MVMAVGFGGGTDDRRRQSATDQRRQTVMVVIRFFFASFQLSVRIRVVGVVNSGQWTSSGQRSQIWSRVCWLTVRKVSTVNSGFGSGSARPYSVWCSWIDFVKPSRLGQLS